MPKPLHFSLPFHPEDLHNAISPVWRNLLSFLKDSAIPSNTKVLLGHTGHNGQSPNVNHNVADPSYTELCIRSLNPR